MSLLSRRGRLLHVLLLFVFFVGRVVADQAGLINGQFFTNGLAIIDAPQANGQQNAGGNMPIAVDVSGDGKLETVGGTSFLSLNIYLVGTDAGVNVTVSEGQQLLDGEPGSTVKHLNFGIPACLPQGNYAVTFYEASRFNGSFFYTVTPIPIRIASKAPAGNFSCISPPPTSPLALPQPDSHIPFSPFVPASTYTSRPLSSGTSQPAASSSSTTTTASLTSGRTTGTTGSPSTAASTTRPLSPGSPTNSAGAVTSSGGGTSGGDGVFVPVSAALPAYDHHIHTLFLLPLFLFLLI